MILGDILLEIFQKTTEIGLTIHSVTSDMGAANQAMWRKFGIITGKHRATKNFIINPSDGRKIYFLADGPHLLKNIKNCLVQNKSIQLSPYFVEKYKLPSNLVKIEHIKTFCVEEETVDLKFAPKLSVDLLNTGHFNKMKVSHALNVLNWDVSCGMRLAAESTEDKSSLTTAFFIDMVSKWFKLISSRTTTLALSKFNLRVYQETLLFLDEFITLFSSLQVAPDKNGKALWKPIQTGVILTTKSILDLQNLFLNEKKYSFLLTSRFSQDCLENVFSQIRSRHPVPTAIQFKQDLKLLSVFQYLDMPFNNNTNYEYDEGAPLTGFLNYIRMNQNKKNYNDNETERNLILPSDWNKHQLSLREKNALYNCAGYVIKTMRKQKICQDCMLALGSKTKRITIRPYSKYVALKEYKAGCLFYVTDKTFQTAVLVEKAFSNLKKYLKKNSYSGNILKILKDGVFADPDYQAIKFRRCCNIKSKFALKLMVYRLTIYSAKLKGEIRIRQKIKWSSKSHAMRDMCSVYLNLA
jgi:hypothetical protein